MRRPYPNNIFGTSGIQLVVRQSLDCDGTPSYGTNDDITCRSTAGTGDFVVTLTGLTANTTYYIIIDGFAGDDCQYDILISQFLILPIKIKSMSATNFGSFNTINWTTESEINNQWQILERSKDGSTSWAEIGRVKGSVGSDGTRSYSLNDSDPFDMTYYRIRSVDNDGKEGISETVYARSFGNAGNVNLIDAIIPNPALDNINILVNPFEGTSSTIKIIDFTGRLFYYNNVFSVTNRLSHNVDISGWPSGMYMLNIQSGDKNDIRK